MSGIARAFGIFGRILSYLRHGRPAVPLLLFLVLQIVLVALYVWSGPRTPEIWALLTPRMNPEIITHYPEHLLYLGSILGRLDMLLEIFILALAQGGTVLLVTAAARRERLGVLASMRAAGRKYLHIVIVAAIASAVLFACYRYPFAFLIETAGASYRLAAIASVLIDVVAQAFFLYAIPFIVIEERSGLDALRRSFGFAGRHFVETLLFALVPFIITAPTILLSLDPLSIARQISPESLIHVRITGEIMQFIATYLLVGAPAILLIETRHGGKKQ